MSSHRASRTIRSKLTRIRRQRDEWEEHMKTAVTALAVCVAVAAGSVRLLGQAGQPPKPGPENKRLGYFVGKWTTEGEMKPGPMGPGGKISSTDTCAWFDGGFAVVCHSVGKTPMGPSKSIGILGYSGEEKVYTYVGLDNSNMSMTSVDGRTESENPRHHQGAVADRLHLQDGNAGEGRSLGSGHGGEEHESGGHQTVK
ncbi:MAG: hypothetical protein DMF85_14150 [Acidobacteria bacterium]|nr:MAG: hypothetical protein DMF85_14150 [Acidobacteriota bacterium]